MKVIDVKPSNVSVLDTKPKNNLVSQPTQVYLETKTILKGQPMGLLLAITYPSQLTFTATRA